MQVAMQFYQQQLMGKCDDIPTNNYIYIENEHRRWVLWCRKETLDYSSYTSCC